MRLLLALQLVGVQRGLQVELLVQVFQFALQVAGLAQFVGLELAVLLLQVGVSSRFYRKIVLLLS